MFMYCLLDFLCWLKASCGFTNSSPALPHWRRKISKLNFSGACKTKQKVFRSNCIEDHRYFPAVELVKHGCAKYWDFPYLFTQASVWNQLLVHFTNPSLDISLICRSQLPWFCGALIWSGWRTWSWPMLLSCFLPREQKKKIPQIVCVDLDFSYTVLFEFSAVKRTRVQAACADQVSAVNAWASPCRVKTLATVTLFPNLNASRWNILGFRPQSEVTLPAMKG